MNIGKIGLSTSAFGYAMGSTGRNTDRRNPTPWTLEEFIDFAKARGFGGIEAPLQRFIPDLDPGRLKQLRSLLSDRDMFFVMDAEAAIDIDEITALIPLAKEFGSSIIRIKSSDILGCARKKLGRPWTEHVQKCIEVLKVLAPQLRENGLRIAIENHQDLDSNDLAQIIESVGADVVGVTFDIGNAFSVCEDPLSFARKLGSSILNIHLKDYTIVKSEDGFRLVRCPLGTGAVDFKTILPLLVKNSPDARMVVELGALEARNISSEAPDFWKEIQPRNSSELALFFQSLDRTMIRTSNDSWKTPWERGASAADITLYETAQLETSLTYLSTL